MQTLMAFLSIHWDIGPEIFTIPKFEVSKVIILLLGLAAAGFFAWAEVKGAKAQGKKPGLMVFLILGAALLALLNWISKTEGNAMSIGPIAPAFYQLMFVLAFLIGVFIMSNAYQREGYDKRELDWLLIAMILATIVGARLGHYAFYDWQQIFKNPLEVFLPIEVTPDGVKFVGFRGLASHGAIFSILPVLYFFGKKFDKPFMWIVDRIAITVALAGTFIRLGNFFNHEIIGKPVEGLPWAVDFAYASEDLDAAGINQEIFRHPTQLYEAGFYFITFLVLWFLYKKLGKRTPHGLLFGIFMVMIFGFRLFVEIFKEAQNANDTSILDSLGLNIGQVLSIPMVVAGLYFWFVYSKKKGKADMEAQLASRSA